MKTSDLRYALSNLDLLKRITDGSLGAGSPAAGGYEGEVPRSWTIFCNSLEKILFIGIGLHFAPAQRNLKVLDF